MTRKTESTTNLTFLVLLIAFSVCVVMIGIGWFSLLLINEGVCNSTNPPSIKKFDNLLDRFCQEKTNVQTAYAIDYSPHYDYLTITCKTARGDFVKYDFFDKKEFEEWLGN